MSTLGASSTKGDDQAKRGLNHENVEALDVEVGILPTPSTVPDSTLPSQRAPRYSPKRSVATSYRVQENAPFARRSRSLNMSPQALEPPTIPPPCVRDRASSLPSLRSHTEGCSCPTIEVPQRQPLERARHQRNADYWLPSRGTHTTAEPVSEVISDPTSPEFALHRAMNESSTENAPLLLRHPDIESYEANVHGQSHLGLKRHGVTERIRRYGASIIDSAERARGLPWEHVDWMQADFDELEPAINIVLLAILVVMVVGGMFVIIGWAINQNTVP